MISRMSESSCSSTYVCTGYLSSGGSSIVLMLRMPESDIWSVLGIGVADSVSTSTFFLRYFIASLCCTPKRCSSSITSSPRSLNFTSFDSILCVPTSTSTLPSATASIVFFCWASFLKRDSISIVQGKFSNRFLNVW